MSDKIPDDQTNNSDSRKEFVNKDMSIEEEHKRKSDMDEGPTTQSSFDSYHSSSKDTATKNPNEEKQTNSSRSFENSIQESLLLGIQESLEALFDMGFTNTSGQSNSYPKIPSVTVFEGGKGDAGNLDTTESSLVDEEIQKNDLSLGQEMKEDVATKTMSSGLISNSFAKLTLMGLVISK